MAKNSGDFDLVLDYAKTKELVKACILAQEPVMVHGMPGIGKSDMMREIAKELGRPLIDIRLALLESVDIKGYPYLKEMTNGEKALSFAMSEEFPTDADSDAIIFFDEINAAMPSTQLAMYQMILDRAIGNYTLPKKVAMVAAGNREADKGGIFSMPKPLENRFVHVEFQPKFEDWASWAISSGQHPEIVGYLAKNEQKLNTFDPQNSSRAFATPRSWAKASKLLKAAEAQYKDPSTIKTLATEFLDSEDANQNEELVLNVSSEAISNIISGCVGMAVANEFMAFRKIAGEVPAANEILSGKAPKLKRSGPDVAYMIITNCLYKLRENHTAWQSETKAKRDDSVKASDDWYKQANNFFQFLIDNEESLGAEFLVLPIRIAIQSYQLPLNVKMVPNISVVITKNRDLLNIVL